jgi:hypothetical protein
MTASHNDRRSDDLIARKHRGGIRCAVAYGERNIRLAGRFYAGSHGRPAEAQRKRMCGGSVAHRKILLMFFATRSCANQAAAAEVRRKYVVRLRRILIR